MGSLDDEGVDPGVLLDVSSWVVDLGSGRPGRRIYRVDSG